MELNTNIFITSNHTLPSIHTHTIYHTHPTPLTIFQVLLKALCVVHSLFSRCVRIQMCSNVLNLQLQLPLRATLCTLLEADKILTDCKGNKTRSGNRGFLTSCDKVPYLEGHVLQKMGYSICFLIFITTASVNPQANLEKRDTISFHQEPG